MKSTPIYEMGSCVIVVVIGGGDCCSGGDGGVNSKLSALGSPIRFY